MPPHGRAISKRPARSVPSSTAADAAAVALLAQQLESSVSLTPSAAPSAPPPPSPNPPSAQPATPASLRLHPLPHVHTGQTPARHAAPSRRPRIMYRHASPLSANLGAPSLSPSSATHQRLAARLRTHVSMSLSSRGSAVSPPNLRFRHRRVSTGSAANGTARHRLRHVVYNLDRRIRLSQLRAHRLNYANDFNGRQLDIAAIIHRVRAMAFAQQQVLDLVHNGASRNEICAAMALAARTAQQLATARFVAADNLVTLVTADHLRPSTTGDTSSAPRPEGTSAGGPNGDAVSPGAAPQQVDPSPRPEAQSAAPEGSAPMAATESTAMDADDDVMQ